MKKIAVIILSAGRSKRMKSEVPKVLHPVCGQPMLSYCLDLAKGIGASKVVVVAGHKHRDVKKIIGAGIKIVIQKQLLGTADAVRQALGSLGNFKGQVLVMYGDMPLLKKETIKKLIRQHVRNNADATILTAKLDKPDGYGRILRDKYAAICGIAEDKDADIFEKEIKEVNTGIICFNKNKLVDALRRVKLNKRKKEYYLTDTVAILYQKGCLLEDIKTEDAFEAIGVNSRQELAVANKIMQERINGELMKQAVTIIDPGSTFISYGVKIGSDTTIYPFTVIERDVKIGKHSAIGPFIHLREGTVIEDNATVGNFVELVRSRIGKGTFVKHFGYLGDTIVGRDVNIGAGTVTANFDKGKKAATIIKDKAFIGCDTVLVAPVKVGRAAKTGAGSVITKHKDVKDNTVVVGIPAKPISAVGGSAKYFGGNHLTNNERSEKDG